MGQIISIISLKEVKWILIVNLVKPFVKVLLKVLLIKLSLCGLTIWLHLKIIVSLKYSHSHFFYGVSSKFNFINFLVWGIVKIVNFIH